MIDSERRESRIPIPARGNGSTELPGSSRPFLRVLYEGGKPWEREPFDWSVALQGLIAPPSLPEAQGIGGGPFPIKDTPVLTHKTPNRNP